MVGIYLFVHGPQAESCGNKCKPPSSKEDVIFVDLTNDNQNKHKLFLEVHTFLRLDTTEVHNSR
jgi:hypothetical protein